MTARYGDANENGEFEGEPLGYESSKRRSTRQFGVGANSQAQVAASHQQPIVFRKFTSDSMQRIQRRRRSWRSNRTQNNNNNNNNSELQFDNRRLEPDPCLASGQQLPPAVARQMPAELVGKPIEDIDPYYADQETFVIISRGKELTRFSAKKALYLLGPFHPIRQVVLYILVSSLFNLLVILTILTNCILMTIQDSEMVERTEIIFTIIYTTELGLKVLARGFILDKFTYLRDPWNWLDFLVIIMAYLTIVVEDLGNVSVIRTFRVLRALKTVAIIPGMKTIVGAVIDSVKNLKDVVVLTLFSLSVFSLLGLQIYMGLLTQKCIANGSDKMNDSQWFKWCNDSAHWMPDLESDIFNAYRLCGNATGAQSCPPEYTCLQGFGKNPDHGFTNFDTFGWALICSFRLMTQDFWEGLYMQVLKTAGSWHIIFFIVSIFLGSIYLMNLILAIVAMSYNELQRRAEEEEEAAAEDEAAFLESCRLMEMAATAAGNNLANNNRAASERGDCELSSSQYCSTPDGIATSYRPSVEIGLVGQSLLASLCQNGLLSERVREQLDQNYMLPGTYGRAGSAAATPPLSAGPTGNLAIGSMSAQLRSHSLSVPPTNQAAGAAAGAPRPEMMATSMTELALMASRRKSSARTCDSYSPPPPSSPIVSRANSLLGQRRLLPNIGVTGNRLDRASIRMRRLSKLASHHVSSSGETMGGYDVTISRQQQQQQQQRLNSARASTTSDRDLQVLKQKAAMIRIVSDDQRATNDTNTRFELLPARPPRRNETLGKRCSTASERCNSDQLLAVAGDPTRAQKRSSIQVMMSRADEQEAICEQPSSMYPQGRAMMTGQLRRPSSRRQSIYHRPNQHQHQQHQNHRRSSVEPSLRRKSTNCSRVELAGDARRTSGSGLPPDRSYSTKTLVHNQRANRQTGSQQRSNGSSPTHSPPLDTAEVSPSSGSPTRGTLAPTMSSYHLQPIDRMHHLSVENFQQFGAIRSPVSDRRSVNTSQQQQQQLQKPRQHSLALDSQMARKLALGAQETQEAPAVAPSLRQRPSFARRESRAYIHPLTMAHSSFSRIRQSIVVPPSPRQLDSLQTTITQQQQQQQQMAGGNPVRRMSRDLVRQAGDWSRLSMSGNVDLRRLLRLWSHTNPYQGARPSIGSCSIYSQTSRNFPAHAAQDSPAQSIRNGPPNGFNSPRPSSVGSQAWQAYEVLAALTRNRYQSDARAYGGALPLDDNLIYNAAAAAAGAAPADRMSIRKRDKCLAYCLSCLDILCIWECCDVWLKIQRLVGLLVFDPFTELFIILCILINTLFMALDSDDADTQMRQIFERGNYFFTATFAVEASMKIIALSPKFYFREGWNVFDSFIVGLSLLELGLEGVYGLSVLRSFRLLRVFKLAKSWPTLNLLISIMGKAVGDLGNLTFVLAIIVFIFAVMGMQLFGTKYVASSFPDGELPRWNFTDFMHSFMIVFRILCAEWIEPMWDCLLVGGWPCIPFFLIAVTVGNLVVLNLFLALLLASFGASNLSSPQSDNVDTKKLQEAIGRFKRLSRFLRRRLIQATHAIGSCLQCGRQVTRERRRKQRRRDINHANDDDDDDDNDDDQNEANNLRLGNREKTKSHIVSMSRMERLQNIERRTEELKSKIRRSPEHHYHLRQLAKSQQKSAASNPTTSQAINYNYPSRGGDRTHTRAEPSCTTTGGDQDELEAAGSHRLRTVASSIIPIIVNEASEGNEDEATGNEQTSEQTAPPTSPRFASDQTNSFGNFADLAELDNSSLTSNGSLNTTIACCQDLDHHHHHNPCYTNEQDCLSHSTVVTFAQNMQTIREDSRDDSSQSLSQTTGAEEQLAPKHQDAGSRRRSISMNEISASSRRHQLEEEEVDQNGAQLHEPLLAKSRSCQLAAAAAAAAADSQQQQPRHECSIDFQFAREAAERPLDDANVAGLESSQVNDDQIINQDHQDEDLEDRPKSSLYLRAPKRQDMEEEDEQTLQHIEKYIERCICLGIVCLKWFLFRQYVRKIVEHKYFDQCILILIIISSGTLALEDKHLNERPTLKQTLDILDTIFTIIFSLEMIFKWLAFGMRRYFGNIWSWLDFVIVLVSFVNLMASIFGSGKIQALKTMRTLRAMRGLRPLRALQRFQGMRVVVNALIQAIPSIFNVLLVCLIFWLIFSIMGVQMFGGKFWRCLSDGETVKYDVAANKVECIERNLTWANPQINFDNVLNAYLALFQVATFKGWIDIMNSATDSRMRDDQPVREANIYMYLYFVFFVIFGSFFTLNLFIGVIIDNFNEQKRKTGGSLEIFMTDDQKKYYHAMKKMRSKRPVKAMTRPKFAPQACMFDMVTSKKFDLAIMIIIGLNMFVMALEHYGQSAEFSQTLELLNLIFIAIFTLECLCKIFAMRHFYFREPWNIFDFIVVDLSILGVVMKEYVAKYFVSPTLLRVVRVVKVGRVLRLVKGAKGIRTLLFALAMSLPALFNICLLLFLVMFIYAIFGMSFFMNVRKRSGIDETFNFETFSSSIIVLFQMSTSAGWDLVLDPLMDEENDCQKPNPAEGIEGTCGNKSIAIFYLISYVIVTFLIIINMYIAVILENYSQATEDVQEGLTDDDYEMYYEIWQKFDPNGSQYLPHSKLSDFVDALEDPLRIAKPNELALVVLDINIYEGNQCYCVDILDALTKYFFTRKGLDIQVNEHLQKVQSTLHETPFERITTTYLLKREHYCARLIQNCWRRWRARTAAAARLRAATHNLDCLSANFQDLNFHNAHNAHDYHYHYNHNHNHHKH